MMLKSFDEMNAEQQFAYKIGFHDARQKVGEAFRPLATPRWCLTHDQPAGPLAYAYCWEGPAQDADCDIETVAVIRITDVVEHGTLQDPT